MAKAIGLLIKITGIEKEEGLDLSNVTLPTMIMAGFSPKITEKLEAMGDWRKALLKIDDDKLKYMLESRNRTRYRT